MKIGYSTVSVPAVELAATAGEVEAKGYHSFWAAETRHDPFVGLTLAGARTSTLQLGTGLAVAFARNPMTMAMVSNDLQLATGGRFSLGLGSQIKAHITRRFGMPWSAPAARMREYVLAMRAIWASFATGDRLRFRGEFYRHTLLVPYFDPGPNPYGNPPVYLGAVGRLMSEVAGEVADGVVMHSLSTRKYYEEVTLPALARGREKAGLAMAGFDVFASPIVATGRDEAELAAAVRHAKEEIAYYISTPSYALMLELHGFEALRDELHTLLAHGRTAEMADAIDGEALRTFAVVGEPADAARQAYERFSGLATTLICHAADYRPDPASWVEFHQELRRLSAPMVAAG
ncbi:MAG TPA: TIGR03617 family F420-dependent LLM class oxidoreductase [Mycobacteriales bacterium]